MTDALINRDYTVPREWAERVGSSGFDSLRVMNGEVLCMVDASWHPSLDALHKHLRKLRLKQEVYYQQHAPRRDLGTGEIIPFKAPASRYLTLDFAHKNNLHRFVKEQPAAAREWAKKWLLQRRLDKGLTYPPLQIELHTLMAPSIPEFDALGGYETICRELGFTIRFGNAVPAGWPLECPIIVDTREQDPLKLMVPTTAGKVNCGDYALPGTHDKGVYIERKSLSDFIGTLSDRETRHNDSNLARFTRELERAKELGGYLILLVETDISQALSFNHLPHIHAEVRPEHIFKNLRELFHQFPDFQALFVAGRREAAKAVPDLLSMGEAVKIFDLQLAYETGKLRFA